MKALTFLMALCISGLALADYSIPKTPTGNPNTSIGIPKTPVGNPNTSIGILPGEGKPSLVAQVVSLTGLKDQDSRYVSALSKCAKNEPEMVTYFKELVSYLQSTEFISKSDKEQLQELQMSRLDIKMSCSQEINAAGIDP